VFGSTLFFFSEATVGLSRTFEMRHTPVREEHDPLGFLQLVKTRNRPYTEP